MRVSFKRRSGEKVTLTARPKRRKTPAHLKKFLFKAGSKKTKACLKKAHAKLRKMGWRFR